MAKRKTWEKIIIIIMLAEIIIRIPLKYIYNPVDNFFYNLFISNQNYWIFIILFHFLSLILINLTTYWAALAFVNKYIGFVKEDIKKISIWILGMSLSIHAILILLDPGKHSVSVPIAYLILYFFIYNYIAKKVKQKN
jgi:hypothetical protein